VRNESFAKIEGLSRQIFQKKLAQLSISNRSKFFILFFQFLFISLCFLLQPRVSTPSRYVLYTIPPPIKLTQWHALGREEQAKYYELARRERQLHMQMYPDWSSRTNATRGKKRKRKQEPNDGGTKSKHLQNLHNSFNCFCTHFSLLLKLNAKFIKARVCAPIRVLSYILQIIAFFATPTLLYSFIMQ
jgi:hypothetical protein